MTDPNNKTEQLEEQPQAEATAEDTIVGETTALGEEETEVGEGDLID